MAEAQFLSHWYQLIEGMSHSTQEFYGALEEAISRRDIPKVKTGRVEHAEGGLLGGKRQYFRVTCRKLIFDVCAAPFGTGFFFSWWLAKKQSFMERLYEMPILGKLLVWLIKPFTYFAIDTALMFQSSVHQAVMDCIDQQTQAQGIRALSADERKPILKEIYKR
jgi:hypothetical protein